MSEQQIQKSILDALKLKYGKTSKFWRNNTGATKTQAGGFLRFGEVGSPDIMGILGPSGQFIALEVKRPKGKTTQVQEAWLQQARLLGARAGVVHSIDEAIALVEGKPAITSELPASTPPRLLISQPHERTSQSLFDAAEAKQAAKKGAK